MALGCLASVARVMCYNSHLVALCCFASVGRLMSVHNLTDGACWTVSCNCSFCFERERAPSCFYDFGIRSACARVLGLSIIVRCLFVGLETVCARVLGLSIVQCLFVVGHYQQL